MKRIYTRTGDKGTTGIHGGERVPKDDIRIEANGCIDELNCILGVVRSLMPQEHSWQMSLFEIQKNLMIVMSLVATPAVKREMNPNVLNNKVVDDCEQLMDRLTSQMKDNHCFILPGGSLVSAQLQLARAVCRRAERRLWTLNRQDAVPEQILQYINRLSDLLFIMSRFEMNQQGYSEERWNTFAYKRKMK